jgi:Bifunctional DNA primase/polymerase, N-terminal
MCLPAARLELAKIADPAVPLVVELPVAPQAPGSDYPDGQLQLRNLDAEPLCSVSRFWPSPHHNPGIACGPSRLVVIDLDTHSPLPEDWRLPGVHDGRDVLALLAEWAGQLWPVTYTVKTSTGGLHLYYTSPPGPEVRNSAGKIGPLIDVRGAGGYVLAAGSVLDERAYPDNPGCRALAAGGRAYEVADDSDPVPLPAWLAILARGGLPAPTSAAGAWWPLRRCPAPRGAPRVTRTRRCR